MLALLGTAHFVSMPRCILHVGPHKTGSTSLQSMLSKKRHALGLDGFDAIEELPGEPDSFLPR